MYARYVPSQKPKAVPAPNEATPPPVTTQPTATASSHNPTSYARFIPTAKPKAQTASQHVHFGDGEDEGHHTVEPAPKKAKLAHDESPAPPKAKKSKKSRKPRSPSPVVELQDEIIEPQDAMDIDEVTTAVGLNQSEATNGTTTAPIPDGQSESADEGDRDEPKSEKKRKKEKKKKKSSESSVDAANEQSAAGDLPARHQAVLDRKAKAMKMAPVPQTQKEDDEDSEMGENEPEEDVLHGLEPIPQPKPVVLESKPTYETLPSWLSEPIRVSPQATAPFTGFRSNPELGISSEVAGKLSSLGYKEAFAIQTAVIPQLLPHSCRTMQGDILVSAATGSGKTLAYALPLMRDLSLGNRHLTCLRAVIVLPTRELVKQAQQVCNDLAGAFALDGSRKRPKIGVAMGSQELAKEQAILISREERYDPEAYAKRQQRIRSGYVGEDDDGWETENEERRDIRRKEDKIATLPDHVIGYRSEVDVLICTPGRLVDHIKWTPGFSLDYVRWLVVDEADKLLSQNFQQWLDVVIPRLETTNVRNARCHKQSSLERVRKVILSATMTRDLDCLSGLKLRRPKLVVLEGATSDENAESRQSQTEHVLPELLEEAALKVSDPNLKPVFLLDLLQSSNIYNTRSPPRAAAARANNDVDDTTSSSGSDSESDDSSSVADTTSDSGSDSDSSSSPATPTATQSPPTTTVDDGRSNKSTKKKPSVLIFTKSNETALRLSRLLSLLSPSFLEPLIGTLASSTAYARRQQTLRAFAAGKLRVLVASDLVARGIDLPDLDHVVNYDMPSSVASYVHRVGRTARAGKGGKAWTLFTDAEARWFWREVAGEEKGKQQSAGSSSSETIKRAGRVSRVRITEEKAEGSGFEAKVESYERALEKLGQEAGEGRNRRAR